MKGRLVLWILFNSLLITDKSFAQDINYKLTRINDILLKAPCNIYLNEINFRFSYRFNKESEGLLVLEETMTNGIFNVKKNYRFTCTLLKESEIFVSSEKEFISVIFFKYPDNSNKIEYIQFANDNISEGKVDELEICLGTITGYEMEQLVNLLKGCFNDFAMICPETIKSPWPKVIEGRSVSSGQNNNKIIDYKYEPITPHEGEVTIYEPEDQEIDGKYVDFPYEADGENLIQEDYSDDDVTIFENEKTYSSDYTTYNNEVKEYYDESWVRIQNSALAEYYRLITYNSYGTPVGEVHRYYVTGELQWKGQVSFTDKNNIANDRYEGLCTWYSRDGNKVREARFEFGKIEGADTYWYEDGAKKAEFTYVNGELHGPFITWHFSGKEYNKGEFIRGRLKKGKYIECDESELCQQIFLDDFDDNLNNWPIDNEAEYSSSIKDGCYNIKVKTNSSIIRSINCEFNQEGSFLLDSYIMMISGTDEYGHGLAWGIKDWDNFYSFEISSDGYYMIRSVIDGVKLDITKWTESSHISMGRAWNRLQINKYGDKMYFSINGNVVESMDFMHLRGYNVGFIVRGMKEIKAENFVIREYISSSTDPNGKDYSGGEYASSGTGFIISMDGYVVTNYHVIEGANEITVEIFKNDMKESYKAILVKGDKDMDLAVLKINDSKFRPFFSIPFAFKIDELPVGSKVFTLGYPLLSMIGDEIRYNEGTISSSTGIQGDRSSYQISVPVQPGNSGSPLFDYQGNLVGIVNSKIMMADNISYAIKSSQLKALLDRMSVRLELPVNSYMSNYDITDQIRILRDYVPIIKVK